VITKKAIENNPTLQRKKRVGFGEQAIGFHY
jgi:hypothetical protein